MKFVVYLATPLVTRISLVYPLNDQVVPLIASPQIVVIPSTYDAVTVDVTNEFPFTNICIMDPVLHAAK